MYTSVRKQQRCIRKDEVLLKAGVKAKHANDVKGMLLDASVIRFPK